MTSVPTNRGGGAGTTALPDAGAIAPLRASQSVAALNASRPARFERPRIWELPGTCHCIVVGTCLSLGELRRVATRLNLFERVERLTDYELHGAFVHALDTRNRASTTVQKLLESSHAGAIRKSLRCRDAVELGAYWDEAVNDGLVAGAFWAVLTHPVLEPVLEKRIFGEVHMMSHLCGASHRGDARTLAVMKRQQAHLAHRLAESTGMHREAVTDREREIERLKRLVAGLEPFVHEVATLRARLQGGAMDSSGDDAALKSREREVASLATLNRSLEAENALLRTRAAEVERRADDLAELLAVRIAPPAEACEAACPLNLAGRCVAYIGGRPQTVTRIRSLVERCNGCLLHHDGGVEQSPHVLEGILAQADIVVVPVDCVSHGAMEKARAACADRRAVFQPIVSSSFSAFAAAMTRVDPATATDVVNA